MINTKTEPRRSLLQVSEIIVRIGIITVVLGWGLVITGALAKIASSLFKAGWNVF